MRNIQQIERPARVATKRSLKLASSHVVVTCATFAALAIFVTTGSQVLPEALRSMVGEGKTNSWLQVAFLLNVAIILFGWRRARDLKEALDAEAVAERRARESAYTDHLTGLGNRRHLIRAIAEACENQARATLLLLDLDHFKDVNDLHGHDAGDEVLIAVAATIREAGPADSQLARLGDDEFAILVPPETANVTEIARRILASVSQARPIDNATVTASIGLSTLHAGLKPEQVLRRADIAMCTAKRDGRNRYSWFDQAMEADLQSAVRRQESDRGGASQRESATPGIAADSHSLHGMTDDPSVRPARRWA
jgi:diguanylate cyclase (GGDEF)-like protein